MDDASLLIDLVLAVLAALIGGTLAQRLGQPAVLGYLVGGVAIGPFTPGPVANQHHVEVLAEIGVAFLMFALGAEFSLSEMRRLGRVATIGGGLQILGTMALGPLLAPALGLSIGQGLFLGGLLALSSTVVALKVLVARGESNAPHGRLALGLLIAQDIAVVPMAIVLPALALGSGDVLAELGSAALTAAGILVAAYVIGTRVVPWVLDHVVAAGSRELFLLGIVALALGTALATSAAGLSLAFGAFLAGLVVAESRYRERVVAEIEPLRDLFVSLFFVSIGMLVNPAALVAHAGPVLLLTAAVVFGKVAIVTGLLLWLRQPGRVALLAALSIAQLGEFAFVLARIGTVDGAIPPSIFDLTLGTAVVTIVLTPFLVRSAPFLSAGLARVPLLRTRFAAVPS